MNTNVVAPKKQPLDEVMLAMDVVDTLRHRQKMVDKELDSDSRDQELRKRLRKIYAAQGIDVPDHIIEEGVAALKEDRFTYKPTADSFAKKLAEIYVNRKVWGKWLFGLLAALMIAWGVYQYTVVAPRAALPGEIEAANRISTQIVKSDYARKLAEQKYANAKTALRNGDYKAARKQLESLSTLHARVEQEYTLKVVSERGVKSGVWRIPDINTRARNYYIIVEAVDASGRHVKVPITNEETGKIKDVSMWGLRVDRRMFDQMKADKLDDGVIQHSRIGTKRRGYLKPDYNIPTSGATITRW